MQADVCVACYGVIHSRGAHRGVQAHPGLLDGIPEGPSSMQRRGGLYWHLIYMCSYYPERRKHERFNHMLI